MREHGGYNRLAEPLDSERGGMGFVRLREVT